MIALIKKNKKERGKEKLIVSISLVVYLTTMSFPLIFKLGHNHSAICRALTIATHFHLSCPKFSSGIITEVI